MSNDESSADASFIIQVQYHCTMNVKFYIVIRKEKTYILILYLLFVLYLLYLLKPK